jgi:WD40 repeat protein
MKIRPMLATLHLALKFSLITTCCCIVLFSFASRSEAQAQSGLIVRVVEWSPDGTKIAVGGGTSPCNPTDPTEFDIRIIDASTQQTIKTLTGLTCQITDIDWSPSGDKIVASSSGDASGYVIWDVESGQMITRDPIGEQGVESVRWDPVLQIDPGSERLAVAYASTGAIIVDPYSGSILTRLRSRGTTVDWRPDGTQLALAGGYDTSVFIENASGQVQELIGHTEGISDLDWNSYGTKLASASGDASVRVWNANTGQSLNVLMGHSQRVTSVAWRPGSDQLASASLDGTLIIWDTNTGLPVEQVHSLGTISDLDWSPDGTKLAYADRSDGVNIIEPKPLPSPDAEAQSGLIVRVVEWSSDGTKIAIGGGPTQCNRSDPTLFDIRIIDANTQQTLKTLAGLTCYITEIDWSPSGDKIAAASADVFGYTIWDTESGQIVARDPIGEQGVASVKWDPTGNERLAVAYANNGAVIVDPYDGSTLTLLRAGGTTVDWRYDGTQLALAGGGYDTSVYIENSSGQIQELVGHTEVIIDLDWNSYGTKLASAGWDSSVRVWNTITGQPLNVLLGHSNVVSSVAWRPGSDQLASASTDGTLIIWDTNTGLPIEQFHLVERLYDLDWSPDGTKLAYADGSDGITVIEPSPLTPLGN